MFEICQVKARLFSEPGTTNSNVQVKLLQNNIKQNLKTQQTTPQKQQQQQQKNKTKKKKSKHKQIQKLHTEVWNHTYFLQGSNNFICIFMCVAKSLCSGYGEDSYMKIKQN